MGALLMSIQSFFYKIANVILGKTTIFIVLFGWFLAVTGLLFLIRPEKARTSILQRGFGILKGILFAAVLYVVLFLFSLQEKARQGGVALVLWIVIIMLICFYFIVQKKIFEALKTKLVIVPIGALKVYSVAQIIVGVIMIMFHKRIL